jgi:hypothetical protein
MAHTAEWTMKLFLFENAQGSTAHVVLDTGTSVLRGEGSSDQHPAGSPTPEVDDEQAAGRALLDLGARLLEIGAGDAAAASLSR